MANPIRKSLGIVTAYGYAKKHNYPRSEAEFGEELANSANYAHQAGESSNEAKTQANKAAGSASSAETAATRASESANQASTHASHVDTVKNQVDTAANQVQKDVIKAGDSVSQATKAVQQIDTKKKEVDASLASLGQVIQDANTATQNAQDAASTAAGVNQKLRETIQQTDAAANGATLAAGKANTAAGRAENSAGLANAAAQKAETAAVTADTATGNVTKATQSANTASGRAEAAAQAANSAGQRSETATGTANTAAERAEKAAQAATTAAGAANTATEAAGTAKMQIEASTATAKTAKSELDQSVQTAGQTNQTLTKSTQDAEKTIAAIDSSTGKVVYYVDLLYRTHVVNAKTAKDVDALFAEWWGINWKEGKVTRQELLDRWFGSVLDDSLVHGVKLPLFATSSSPSGELTDDSIGLVCEPSTASAAGRDDFAKLPQFWCLEVSAEKRPDGSHEIYAVEHIDPIEKVRDGTHLTWVLQKNTYTKEWADGQYHYVQMQCHPAEGFTQWPQGTDRTGKKYAYIANPKYAAGTLPDGRITCGTGLRPAVYTSHQAGVSKWRQRGSQYAGASGCLAKWQWTMIALKYAKKSNSGTIEGCSWHWWQLKAAISETGVQRIILSESDGKKVKPGMSVSIGTGKDQWVGTFNSIANIVRVASVQSVTLSGKPYTAVTVENGEKTFNTVAGETGIYSQPYYSGYNDDVLGYDGARTDLTGGTEPGLIQKTEFQMGSYLIVADELWKWSQPGGANTDYCFDCYTCHDQSKVSGSTITADYTWQEDLRLTFPSNTAEEWMYIEDMAIGKDKGVLWPKKVSKAAGSGTGCKDGFYVAPRSDGIRAAWLFAYLDSGGIAGLCARYASYGTTSSYWYGCVGAPGLSG